MNRCANSPFSITHREKSIENQVSKRLFAHHRRSLSVSVLEQQGSHIGIRAEARTLIAQQFATSISQFLRRSLLSALSRRFCVSIAKPHSSSSRLFVLAERGEDIRIAGQLDIHLAVTLFELFIRSLRRTVITDGGSLDDESCSGARLVTASYISRAETISTRVTPCGVSSAVGPETSVASAPRMAARAAIA